MAKQNFSMYTPRDQHKKRPGIHKKSQNKSERGNRLGDHFNIDLDVTDSSETAGN